MTDDKKAYTDEETRKHYSDVTALIINGDTEKKKKLDACATALLTRMRTLFPTLPDKVLASFSASIYYLFAAAMTVQARDLSEFMEHTFNDYLFTTAVLLGAYDPMSTEVPPVPEVKAPEVAPVDDDYRPGVYL